MTSLSLENLIDSRSTSTYGPKGQDRCHWNVPLRLLANKDLEKMVETSDEWIYSRVGIRERHLVERGMATSDMTVEAAKRYLDSRGILATDVEA